MRVHIGHTKEGDTISFQYTDKVYCANKTLHKKICFMIVQGVLQEDPKWTSGEWELHLMISSPEESEGEVAVIRCRTARWWKERQSKAVARSSS